MKLYNFAAAIWTIVSLVPTTTAAPVEAADISSTDNLSQNTNDILDTSTQPANASELNQNTNFSHGSKVVNSSFQNPTGPVIFTSS